MEVARFFLTRRGASANEPSHTGSSGGPPALTPDQAVMLPHDSAGPKLNAVFWVRSTVSGLFMAARLYAKRLRGRAYWWDDLLLLASWVVNLVAICIISYCVSLGLGKHTWDVDPRNFVLLLRASNVTATLSIIASIWSKTSFALTVLRLTDGWLRRLVWFLIASINVAMGVTALLAWIHCTPLEKLWDSQAEGTCWPREIVQYYNFFSAAYSGVVDISLVLIAWKLLLSLHMDRVAKIGAAIAMSMGVFAGVASFVKTYQLWSMLSPDIYEAVDLLIWSNAEITVTIMAASIPVLRAFIFDIWSPSRETSTSEAPGSNKTDSIKWPSSSLNGRT